MIVFGANMAIEGIQDLWHVINGDLDTESVNLIKEATGHRADNIVDLTELAVSVGSAKAVSKTTSKAFSEASSKLKDALGKAKKVGTAVTDEARAMAKSARLAVRKQLLRFRKPRRTATRVDLDGLMKEYRIPSTLSEEQRAACDAVGLEMKYGTDSIKNAIKSEKLPTEGKIRYIPPKRWHVGEPLPKQGRGFIDKFGNVWQVGSSRTAGQSFEWDVQLSPQGKAQLGWATRDI